MKKIESSPGAHINSAIEGAIKQAAIEGPIEFDFNGVTIQVEADSDSKLIYRDWNRGMLRPSNTFVVTAHPPRLLSEGQLDEDARLRDAQRKREREARAVYEKRQQDKVAQLKEALQDAPFLSLKDKDGWSQAVENNKDPYGAACVRFAENWGRLMQARIEQGAQLADVADECCSIAGGPEGITGFMYDCAVSMLSQVWEHGEVLRQWHNLKTQLGNEGEQANKSSGVPMLSLSSGYKFTKRLC